MQRKIRDLMVKGLYESTGLLAIDTDNPNKKPKYPYYSFKFTTFRQNAGDGGNLSYSFVESEHSEFKHDVLEELTFQPKVVMSFNSYSNDILECQEVALKAWEWFKLKSKTLFSDNNIVVVNVGNVQDRTVHLVDSYEYRQGFDVEFRILHRFNSRSETIESYKVKGEII